MLVSALNSPPKGDQSWQEPDQEWPGSEGEMSAKEFSQIL
jgi:hypothetical protein